MFGRVLNTPHSMECGLEVSHSIACGNLIYTGKFMVGIGFQQKFLYLLHIPSADYFLLYR